MDNEEQNGNPATGPAKQPRLFTAIFIVIVAITLCSFITGQGLNSGTSVYINRLGGSATLAGVGALSFSIAAIVGRLFAGPLADSRGRLIVITIGTALLLVGVLGAALCGNLEILMLWRLVQGFGFSVVTTAAATAAADVLPAERLGEGIGYYGLGQALAMSIGPAIAIALVATDPPENLFWGLACAPALALALCPFCRYERNTERLPETSTYRRLAQQRERERAEAAARGESPDDKAQRAPLLSRIVEPGALVGGIPAMVLSPAFGFGIFFVGLLGTELGMDNAGLFYTVSAISMVAVRLSSKAFMDRVLPIKLFAIAVASGIVCYSILLVVTLGVFEGFAQNALFYTAGLFYGLCLGLALPVNQTVAVKNSPAERWGAANGLFLLLFDVGIGAASVAWGITNDMFGFTFTVCCVIALIALSLLVAFITYPPSAKRR